ncbi:hypothetical protein RF11_15590 [Thelohanellus kitauei]|uniref:Uncharacterized protein n=1 Tax=Thelohanellus kitauei TaxID=669202 RepID=A0A0C2MSY6_THEKT|nr:hypothetical protein RF11_15590 [Thelohanellus kitauei]
MENQENQSSAFNSKNFERGNRSHPILTEQWNQHLRDSQAIWRQCSYRKEWKPSCKVYISQKNCCGISWMRIPHAKYGRRVICSSRGPTSEFHKTLKMVRVIPERRNDSSTIVLHKEYTINLLPIAQTSDV